VQFFAKLESDTFVLPDYDADVHADSFPGDNFLLISFFFSLWFRFVWFFSLLNPSYSLVEEIPVEVESKPATEVVMTEGGEIEDSEMKVDKPAEPKNTALTQQLVPRLAHDRIANDLELSKKLASHFDRMRSIPSNVLLGKFGMTPPAETEPEAKPEEVKAPESFTQLHQKIIAYSEKYVMTSFLS
jgi:hypothetical protein